MSGRLSYICSSISVLLASIAGLFSPDIAFARVIYQSVPDLNATPSIYYLSGIGSSAGPVILYNPFSTITSADVGSISIANSGGTYGSTLTVYNDDGGRPGSVVFTEPYNSDTALTYRTGNDSFVSKFPSVNRLIPAGNYLLSLYSPTGSLGISQFSGGSSPSFAYIPDYSEYTTPGPLSSGFSISTASNIIYNVSVAPDPNDKARITASFSPTQDGAPVSIASAAQQLGFTGFNWFQEVTEDPLPIPGRNPPYNNLPPLHTPFVDPPLGGYTYQNLPNRGPVSNNYPFYLNSDQVQPLNNGYTIEFNDKPGASHLKVGESIQFLTELVGILPGSTEDKPLFDPLYAFKWETGYSGVDELAGVSSPLYDGQGVTVLGTNLDINDLPLSERELMTQNGAQGVSLVSPAPEPTQWTMLMLGVALVGMTLRNKGKCGTYRKWDIPT